MSDRSAESPRPRVASSARPSTARGGGGGRGRSLDTARLPHRKGGADPLCPPPLLCSHSASAEAGGLSRPSLCAWAVRLNPRARHFECLRGGDRPRSQHRRAVSLVPACRRGFLPCRRPRLPRGGGDVRPGDLLGRKARRARGLGRCFPWLPPALATEAGRLGVLTHAPKESSAVLCRGFGRDRYPFWPGPCHLIHSKTADILWPHSANMPELRHPPRQHMTLPSKSR